MRSLLQCFLYLCIALSSGLFSYAQHPYFYSINENQGLPSNEVYELIQDDFGHIWIASDAGLFRYDGFSFKEFKGKNQKSASISTLKHNSKGEIFCRNFSGQIFTVRNDSLQLVYQYSKFGPTSNKYVISSKNEIWIVQHNKIKNLDAQGNLLNEYKIPTTDSVFYLVDAFMYHDKFYISSMDGQVSIFNTESKTFVYNHQPSTSENLLFKNFFNYRNQVYILSKGLNASAFKIYLADQHGSLLTHEIRSKSPMLKIQKFNENSRGELWISTSQGIVKYQPKVSTWEDMPWMFRGENISSVYVDKEDITWATSLNEGIFVIPNLDVRSLDFKNNPYSATNFTALHILNDQEFFIGTQTGQIFYYNKAQKYLELLNKSDKSAMVRQFVSTGNATYVAHGNISKIENKKITYSSPIFNPRRFTIIRDSIFFVSPETNGKIGLSELFKKEINIKKNPYAGGRFIYQDPLDQSLYFSLSDGLFKLKNGKWEHVKIQGESIFPSHIVACKNFIILTTQSNGLIVLKNGIFFAKINEFNSPINEPIHLVHCSNEYFWAISQNYIYRIHLVDFALTKFNSLIGIPPQDINAIESYQDKIYFATNRSIKYMPEDLAWNTSIKPTIRIDSYQTLDGKYPISKEIRLKHHSSKLEINYEAISLKNRSNYKVAYRMLGLDSNWNYTNAGSYQILYPSIPSGSYTLQVKTVDFNQTESRTIDTYILVDSPIWLKWWFGVLSGSLVGLFIFLTLKYRDNRRRHRQMLEDRLIASNLSALRAQMNPHFLFNSLNSIQALILKLDVSNANFYMTTFSHLLRKILEASDQDYITVSKELVIMKAYLELEKLRFGVDFHFEIHVDPDIDIEDYCIPPMMLQPFIENSLKHGLLHKKGYKELLIHLTLEDVLRVSIKDNGVGRAKSAAINTRQFQKHTSFATDAMRKRIELLSEYHKMEFKIETIDLFENDVPCGTLVNIQIPDTRFGN